MKLAVALVFLVVGSLVFHFISPWWFTPIASNWESVDFTINVTFWVTGLVFVAVNLFMAYAIYKYKHQKDRKAFYEPENKKLEWWLTGLTALGVAAMLAPGLVVWQDFIAAPEDADEIEVVGQQWQWSFRFPGADGKLGKSDPRFISQDNPLGLDVSDELGLDDVIVYSNELRLPLNRPVKVWLRSKDVLHNFAVPQFRVKMDLVPGLVSYLWFTPTRTGSFDLMCMELCGIAHYAMRGKVIVNTQEDFDLWLSAQPTFTQTQHIARGDPAVGESLYTMCVACHGQEAEGNVALNAPALSGQSDWYLARQLKYYQQGVRGTHEKDTYGQQMAPMAAVLQDDAAINHVVAYIDTLPSRKPQDTITGNVERGKSLYTTCGSCHGRQGEGKFALSAPKLAGVQDWYLKRQLSNFKQGIRGTHDSDYHGAQMILMAKMLTDDQSINDLVSYLGTL